MELFGGLAALGSAASWALGSILFRRIGDVASPTAMNLVKGLVGLPLLAVVLVVVGTSPIDRTSLVFLVLSGLVGIAMGDTLFFMSLVRLQPRLTVLLGTVGIVFTGLLGIVVLGERPSRLMWLGMVAVVVGVTWVLLERAAPSEGGTDRLAGVLFGLLAGLCMAGGIVLARLAVARVSPLEATVVRLGAAMAGLAAFGAIRGRLGAWLAPFAEPALLRRMVVAVAVIMFGGFYLSLVALRYAGATVATVLGATEPLFVLPLVVTMDGERLSLRAVVGAAVAVAGVALVLSSLD